MKNHLVVVGKELYTNPPFMAYLLREVEHFGELDQLVKLEATRPDTVTLLQQKIAKRGNLIIVADKKSFTPVSKLLATMTGDTLVLRDNLLLPTRCDVYDDNSFLIVHEGCLINVVQAEPGKTLPMLLLDPDSERGVMHLFDIDPQSADVLLDPLAKSHDIELTGTEIVPGWLRYECESRKYGQTESFLQSVRQLLPNKAITVSDPIAYLIERFTHYKKSVTFAESCTGGRLAAELTARAGSSAVFRGALITYSNAIKAGWLGVDKEILQTHGAVSEACVSQMLDGAVTVTKADYAVAVSGIAGPGGGTPQKPVGTVYIGVKSPDGKVIEKLFFEGDRNYIQEQSLYYGYKLLFRAAEKEIFSKNP